MSRARQVYEEGSSYNEEIKIVNGKKEEKVDSENWKSGPDDLKRHFRTERAIERPERPSRWKDIRPSFTPMIRDQHSPFERAFSRDDRRFAEPPSWWHQRPSNGFFDPPPYTHEYPFAPISARPVGSSVAVARAGSPKISESGSEICNTDTGFVVRLDVSHFSADDIKVCVSESTLSIEGERIFNEGMESYRRTFARKYNLPDDIDVNSIKSTIDDCGFLSVKGNRKAIKGWRETSIPVQHVASSKLRRYSENAHNQSDETDV